MRWLSWRTMRARSWQSKREKCVSRRHGPWEAAVVGQGFCEIANNRVMLLADTIEKPEEIDRIRAQEALERAKERLRQKQSISEYYSTRAAMARALVRLKETEKFVD